MKKYFKDLLKEHKPTIGTFCMMPSPAIVEALAYAGFEYILIDMEHTCTNDTLLVDMLRACDAAGAASLVRVSEANETQIKHVLANGASGILVPHVESAEAARRVVKMTRYYPLGELSTCPFDRDFMYGVDGFNAFTKEHNVMQEANEKRYVCVCIETAQGIENLPEILSVEGIDAIDIGMCDLAVSLGVNYMEHPLVREAATKALHMAHEYGKTIIFATPEEETMAFWINEGCDAALYYTDCAIISQTGRMLYENLKKYREY